MSNDSKNPILASFLSVIIPGLGQLYNGERSKGLTMLVMVFGMAVSCIFFQSSSTYLLIGIAYLAVLVPATIDAYRVANNEPTSFSGDAPWYVIGLLVCIGPFALPLLWQTPRISRANKVALTIVVMLVALLSILTLAWLGPKLDELKHGLAMGMN